MGVCEMGPVCRIVQQDRLHGKVTATQAPGFAARLARMLRAGSLPGRKRRRRPLRPPVPPPQRGTIGGLLD